MELFSYFRSSCSYRVRIVLNLKKIPFDTTAIHLIKDGGEQNKADYLERNPMGQVPFLMFDDTHGVAQSTAIIQYLDEVYPEPAMMPLKPFERAQVTQIVEMINAGIQPIQNLRVMQKLKSDFKASDEDAKKWSHHWIKQGFDALETVVKQTAGRYCFKDQITTADAFLVPQIYNANRFKVDMGNYPTLSRINEDCLKLEAFQKASPENQPDTPK